MCGCTSGFDGDNSYDNFLTKKSKERRKTQKELMDSGLSRKDAREQALAKIPKEKLKEILARLKAGDKIKQVADVVLDPNTQVAIKELTDVLEGNVPTANDTGTGTGTDTPIKAPMSTTTKIIIGVGIVALLGAGYYFMKKRK
jgi:hypothetical protein